MLGFNPEPIKLINPLKKHLLNHDDERYNQDYVVTKKARLLGLC